VRRELEAERFETPKAGDPIFAKVRNVLIGNNKKSQRAMVAKAKELGYRAFEVEPYVLGDAREAAPRLLDQSRALAGKARAAAVVAGGETTVVVRGKGRGGRNQEMALVDLGLLREGELFAAAGTDGIDGKSPGAGALADAAVAARAKGLALDARTFLDNNDSTSFFERAGGLLITGPTGTNVADVELLLIGAPKKARGGK
jgi:hydroxypyruvate reductase